MTCKLKKKKYMGPQFPIFCLIFQISCDDYQCLILVFSVIYLRLMGIYGGGGGRPGILKSFFPSFHFFFFFFLSFLFFVFFFSFVSFSGDPLAPGPLDIVHPCHPVATPLSKLTKINKWQIEKKHHCQSGFCMFLTVALWKVSASFCCNASLMIH